MRAGIVHLVFGVLLLVAGYIADTHGAAIQLSDGHTVTVFWWGVYIVGAFEIVRGIGIIIRMRRIMRE